MSSSLQKKCICGSEQFIESFQYKEKPKLENIFSFSKTGTYQRTIYQCCFCSHMLSIHSMGDGGFYEKDYVDSTYKDLAGIKKTFKKIMELPPGKSDNRERCQFVDQFMSKRIKRDLIDIGGGLGVFIAGMKNLGWTCTFLDPDERATAHARTEIGVSAIHGDFFEAKPDRQYSLITFNKVLEHVKDPIAMLKKAKDFLHADGFAYIELPDGEAAIQEGFEREEFFIEHHHIFSAASIAVLANRAGFNLIHLERIREPSSKFTLRACLSLQR